MSDLLLGTSARRLAPSFQEAALLWLKVGFLSFGGAPAQIALLHRLVVEEHKWLDEKRFLHALNYCMLLPGPEAQQLATYIGWLLHGVRGGLVAGIAFVLPGAIVMFGLSFLYVLGSGIGVVDGLFFGIKCAVLAILAEALLRIARRALKGPGPIAIAVFAFLGLALLDLAFPLIILAAALLSALLAPRLPHLFGLAAADPGRSDTALPRLVPMHALSTIAIWLLVWFAPIVLAALLLGNGHRLVEIGLFFSKLAMLTFGGAYALTAWLAQAAVETKGWLNAGEMIDGLGLAETKPGPTVLVNQFVAFLAAYRAPEPFPALFSAFLGGMMALWATFAPSFLWIFAGAPFIERLRGQVRLSAALAGITAAVVGVIAWLALWFGMQVLFAKVTIAQPGLFRMIAVDLSSIRPLAVLLSALSFSLLFLWHRSLPTTIAILAVLGVVTHWI